MFQFEPYQTRPVRFLELLEYGGWRLKVYGISATGEFPNSDLVEQARGIARAHLPKEAITDQQYGVGFVIVHEGAVGDYVFVDWWWANDIVQHHLFGAKKGGGFEYRQPEGAGFCVWELAVIWFEREAWVKHILQKAKSPDLEGYLNERMNVDV